ncbi:MAG: TonB-dependent receptor [Acidobacteria bacterium]|nr:TonB-dependent receptor [Acidobacteriota bacterium]
MGHRRVSRGLCALFVLWLNGLAGAAAQTNTGEISGLVRDATGGVVPGAIVTATHAASGTVASRTTDRDGRFFLPALRIGAWELTVSMSGFQPRTTRVPLEIGRTLQLEIVLAAAARAEDVTVTASDVPLLQTANAEISDVIGTREVLHLPISGRNFLALAQLSDSVVLPPSGTRGDALQQAGPLPNVGGQRSGHNIYLLDGLKVTDELFNNLVISPSVDSIEEFKIQKSMYPAEFGGKASALINVATKAGTNTIGGTLFEFYRNDAFDAPNFFLPAGQAVPPLRQHQFGGSFGGPIVRSRTFFFGSYEGQHLQRSLTRTFSVPSLAARDGNFAGSAPICDPETIVAGGSCLPFAGNRIPLDRLDPIARTFLRDVPLPTAAGESQNLAAVEALERDVHQISGRIDHRISDADSLFVRFSTFDADERQPFGTSVLQEALVPGFGRTLTTRTRNLAVSHARVIGGAMLNEARFGWMRVRGGQQSVNRGVDFAGGTGLIGVTRDPRDVGYPQISTAGLYSTMGDPTSFVARNNQHVELYDNLSFDRGRHRLKVGAYFFRLWLRPEQPDAARGAFTYTGQFSGNALADFLLGYPASATSGIGRGDEDGRTNWFHAYAQDDWQVRPNLTVNLGLRYEFNQHMYDVNNRLSTVDLSVPGGRFVVASDDAGTVHQSGAALMPLVPIPATTTAALGWGRGLLDPSAVRLAPRTGFALSLDDGRGVVRGGYGVFLNQWAYSVQAAFARNLPFFFTKQVDVPADAKVPLYRTRDILTANATGTIGASIMDYDYNVEYSQTWSGGVQYEWRPGLLTEVFYMGTWTLGADNATVRNVPEPGPGPIQARRPIPALSRITAIRFDGKSIYHGVTVKAERPLRRGFAFTVGYTWSSSKDDASSPGATEAEANVPQDVRNVFGTGGEWARSSFDRRHQLIATATVELPSPARGTWREAVLGNWRVSAAATALSGAPFTVNLGVDRANVGAGPAQRPDQLRDPDLPGGQRTPERWFDTDAFALPALYTFGSAPRNSVTGPGYANVDLVVAKSWRTRHGTIEWRWETYNLLNRTNFDLPNRVFGSSTFGRILSAKNAREMQGALRFLF